MSWVGPGIISAGILLFLCLLFVPNDLREKWSGFATTVFTTGAGMTQIPSSRRRSTDVDVNDGGNAQVTIEGS